MINYSAPVSFITMSHHRFNLVEMETNGCGYVSTSIPMPHRERLLRVAYTIRDMMIDGRSMYRKHTPTIFYPTVREATHDQLKALMPLFDRTRFTLHNHRAIAIYGPLHLLCQPCWHRMQRVIVITGPTYEGFDWELANASAILHIRQMRGITVMHTDEAKEAIKDVANKIYQNITEGSGYVSSTSGAGPLRWSTGIDSSISGRSGSSTTDASRIAPHGV